MRSDRVSDVRVGAHSGKVRLVLDMVAATPRYAIHRARNGLDLVVKKPEAAAPAVAELVIDGKQVPVTVESPQLTVRPEPAPEALRCPQPPGCRTHRPGPKWRCRFAAKGQGMPLRVR